MRTKGRLTLPIETDEGLEVVRLITEGNKIYALMKVPIEDVPNVRVLKTDRERREYQREIQKRYRKKVKRKRVN